jgi:hypothetical protein
MMRICYVDEAGCTGPLPKAVCDIQPVFVLSGVDFPQSCIANVTRDFLHLKQRFFPHSTSRDTPYLGWMLTEIKGSELRKRGVDPSRNKRRHSLGFMHETLALLESNGARVYGRVWVKEIGGPVDGRAMYTYSLQYICDQFNRALHNEGGSGILVCDSRNKVMNSVASHSIFTQKFKATGDAYPHIMEMPVFGHSENHAGVQIADLICSALLFPLAVHAYCRGHVQGTHVRDYSILAERFTERLEALQPRYADPSRMGRDVGGVMVDDRIGRRHRTLMFPGGRHPHGARNAA